MYTSRCFSCRPTWHSSFPSMDQGRNKSENKNCWPLPLCFNPHPIPTDTFEALWHRGDVWCPPPRLLGSWGRVVYNLIYVVTAAGCDLGLRLIQTKEMAIEADLWGCLLCLAAGERGLSLQGHTSQSVLGFPWLYEWTDWLETLKLWTVQCVTLSMHLFPCTRRTGKHFITIASNMTYSMLFFFFFVCEMM